MPAESSHNPAEGPAPPFAHCPQCRYALRRLPANHTCPECGLRYDERCAIYRATNPTQILAFWLMIFGGGWVSLRNLPTLLHLDQASVWEWIVAWGAVVWLVCVAIGVFFLIRKHRRGWYVAITRDGLLPHLPAIDTNMIAWERIESVRVPDRPQSKPAVVQIVLAPKGKRIEIGGLANVFPTRADAERFADEVAARLNPPESDQTRQTPAVS